MVLAVPRRLANFAWYTLAAVVIGYAFFAGLRPVGGDDLFFLLNDARWLLENGAVPWTDHFSFTAQGQPWVYPLGGGLIFYGLWAVGGFGAISVFVAAVAAGTVALILRRGSVISAVLAAVMVPVIVTRTGARADLFSTAMIAAYIVLLSRYQQTGRVRLWLLPGLMFLWVNLHLGFVFGLVLIGAYVGFGALQTAWGMEGASARQRLRAAMPWFALTFAATFANPYGPWVYEALWHQYRDGPWSAGLGEWSQIPFPTWALLERVFVPGDPRGQIYAAFAIGLILVAIAVWHRRFGAAFALAGAVVLTAEFQRLVTLLHGSAGWTQ
jgi:hypothetical protein